MSLNQLLVFLPHLIACFANRFIGRGFAIVFTCFAKAYSRPDPGISVKFSSPIVIELFSGYFLSSREERATFVNMLW